MDQDTESRCSSSPVSTTLGIDSNRNHLAILESYQLLQDLKSSPNLNPEVSRCLTRVLLRLHFFLIHSPSPLLTRSDREALARFHHLDLALSLDQAHDRVRDLARDRHR